MLSVNEAIFMTQKEKKEVAKAIEQFKQIANCNDLHVMIEETTYMDRQTGVKLQICEDPYSSESKVYEKTFTKSPCTESFGTYMDRLKSYLFSIAAEICCA